MPIPSRFLDPTNHDLPFHDLAPDVAEALLQEAGPDLVLLDVRTIPEHGSHRIPGSTLVPVQELMARVTELDPARPTLVYCEHGVRSVRAALFLREQGFQVIFNLRGGIVAWQGSLEGHSC